MISALTEDNILESILQNGECALQLVNYYISNRVTQIRNIHNNRRKGCDM